MKLIRWLRRRLGGTPPRPKWDFKVPGVYMRARAGEDIRKDRLVVGRCSEGGDAGDWLEVAPGEIPSQPAPTMPSSALENGQGMASGPKRVARYQVEGK